LSDCRMFPGMHFGLMSNMAADRRDTTLSLTINLTQAIFTVAIRYDGT